VQSGSGRRVAGDASDSSEILLARPAGLPVSGGGGVYIGHVMLYVASSSEYFLIGLRGFGDTSLTCPRRKLLSPFCRSIPRRAAAISAWKAFLQKGFQ
jgi:hypothetical protein